MLDVVANTQWKRPVYFTGGSFGDDDYLWMKDYLQLDGVCYKLVPIRTPVDPKDPFSMGRIDHEKMYSIVSNWEWGNSGSDKIYHDPETRKNAITYRSNLARLTESLLAAGEEEKALEIINLAMEKMPLDKFGYYSLVEPFIDGYYKVGEKQLARDLWNRTAEKYQEYLAYYSQLDLERQYMLGDEIVSNIQRYRSLIDLLVINQDEEIFEEKVKAFNKHLTLFNHFYGDDESMLENESLEESSSLKEDDVQPNLPDDNLLVNPDSLPL